MKHVLCGYMGCGKSHIGKKLAQRLHWPFFDLDREIEKRESKNIQEIFQKKGEIYFRKREMEVLKELVSQPENFVLALGGGTPCYGENLTTIQQSGAFLHYLKVSLDNLTQRLWAEKDSRPLISQIEDRETLEEFIQKHLFERQFYYLQADRITELDKCSSENEIMDRLMA